MPTNKHRIAGYLPDNVHDRFQAFREQQGLSESKALTLVLSEYFKVSQKVAHLVAHQVIAREEFDELSAKVAHFESLLSEHKFKSGSRSESERLVEFVMKSFVLSTSSLSERIRVPRNTMKRHMEGMTDEELAEYTREHDPDGFAWERCEEPAMFRPIVAG